MCAAETRHTGWLQWPIVMETLMDTATGSYLVLTASGASYEIDLDHKPLTRRWNTDGTDEGDDIEDHRLRRDGHSIDLLDLVECTAGRRMIILVNLHQKGVYFTARMSTTVMTITPAVPGSPDRSSTTGEAKW